MKALLIGTEPLYPLGYTYVTESPYDAVVIGSLTLSQQLSFQEEAVLSALANGIPVILYTPGLAGAPHNRSLSATLSARRRELKNWGIVFTEGISKKLITAETARQLKDRGEPLPPGAVLTPLAKEILQ